MAQTSLPVEPKKWFRADINGLRALGILPVVIFHAGITAIPGGFVGVDVFYVISGFLITTILLRELETSGRLRFGSFWAKRLRRLVPGLALMVAVTLAASALILSPLQWPTLAKQGGASLVYVSNILFAQQATDYFGGGVAQSPFLHTWSLGVEEQFYLVWPLLVVFGAWVAHKRRAPARFILACVFSATLIVSLAMSIVFTATNPSWAFYMLPTRAWEFAAAGLLATVPLEKFVRTRTTGTIVTVAGLGLLAFSFFAIHETDPFPGALAMIPVAGTLLVIAGGTAANSDSQGWPSRVLATKPIQWIGTVSYSWYLWHWPFIVLAVALFNTESRWVKVAAAVASLGVATASYYLVENPLRFAPLFTRSLRRTFIGAAAATAAAGLIAASMFFGTKFVVDEQSVYVAARTELPTSECVAETHTENGIAICESGDLNSKKTVLLIGDSHAGHWAAAADEAAQAAGIRLIVRWRSACPAISVQILKDGNERDPFCQTFQSTSVALVEELRPDAVIVSQAAAYDGRILSGSGKPIPVAEQQEVWRDAYDNFLESVIPLTANVAVITDNPRLDSDPIECLTRFGAKPKDCAVSRDEALKGIRLLNTVSAEVLEQHAVMDHFDVADEICSSEVCRVVDDGIPVFRDDNHLSRAWTQTQVPRLSDWIVTIT